MTRSSARRLFLGVPPDARSVKELSALQQQRKLVLGGGPGIQWLGHADLHLTLHFLGSVNALAEGVLWSSLGMGGLGVACEQPFDRWFHFPTADRPRVEAVGAETAVPDLQSLWETLGERIVEAGLAVESRPYVPHVTIARFRGGTVPPAPQLGAFLYRVRSVALYESFPVGPRRYRILQEFALDSDA